MQVNFFAKTKTNMSNLPPSRWKTTEILKIVKFQSLNFTSKPKGLNNKIVGKADHTYTEERKKATKPKRRSKLFKREKGKDAFNKCLCPN